MRVASYLKSNLTNGGGSKSVTSIALKTFSKQYRDLTKKQKRVVDTLQQRGQTWRNDHLMSAVFSTQCMKFLPMNAPS